jgi:hypothetical protein
MQRRGGKLLRVLAVAAAAAVLVSTLPGSVATADRGDCKVHNIGKGINRDSLQRAVWAADAGDSLLVQGICTGTTLIAKNFDISYMGWAGAPMPLGKQYIASPRGKIRSGSWQPALVIDPNADDFAINPGLRVLGGIIIDELADWRGDAKPVPTAWKTLNPSASVPDWNARLRSCYVRTDGTGDKYRRSQAAVGAASADDQLSVRGTCAGKTVIDKDLSMTGWRVAISGTRLGSKQVSRDDSGPPTLTRVTVDDDVESLVLKRLRVTNGFSIEDLEP